MNGLFAFLFLISFKCIVNTMEDKEVALSYFHQFNSKYNKKYSSHYEFITKLKIFSYNLQFIHRYDKFSPFMDLDDSEFSKRLGLKHSSMFKPQSINLNDYLLTIKNRKSFLNYNDDEDELDYRNIGAVSSVTDQGNCGSCWAFATIGTIEGQVKILYDLTRKLSVQELLDCDNITFDDGCNGGSMADALSFLITKKVGVMTEEDYPYEATKHDKCYFNIKKEMYFLDSLIHANHSDEDGLKSLLRVYGPIAITINASSWKYYIDGVYRPTPKTCDPKYTNHAVLLIGYGSEGGVDYWIIKNSWGTDWGENGFIRMERGTNACGITENAYIAQMKTFQDKE